MFTIPIATGAHTTTMSTIPMAITLSTNNSAPTIGLLLEAIAGIIPTLITSTGMAMNNGISRRLTTLSGVIISELTGTSIVIHTNQKIAQTTMITLTTIHIVTTIMTTTQTVMVTVLINLRNTMD